MPWASGEHLPTLVRNPSGQLVNAPMPVKYISLRRCRLTQWPVVLGGPYDLSEFAFFIVNMPAAARPSPWRDKL